MPVPSPLQYEQLGKMGMILMVLWFQERVARQYVGRKCLLTPRNLSLRNSKDMQRSGGKSHSQHCVMACWCVVSWEVQSLVDCLSLVLLFTGPFPDDLLFRKAIGESYHLTAGHRRTPEEITDSLPPFVDSHLESLRLWCPGTFSSMVQRSQGSLTGNSRDGILSIGKIRDEEWKVSGVFIP